MNGGRKEKRFLDELEALFTGAEVDGKHSGFVNLMRIKQRYFQSIKPQLMAAIDQRAKPQKTRRFYFDASEVKHKQNNERREFVFDFDEIKKTAEGRVIHLKVAYTRGGTKTKTAAILKEARRGGISLTDDQLQKALGVFRRQTEVDYFINKDAKGFLREQFDLWMYQYLFQEETVFEQKRIKQLQALKETAYDIIHFIAQFEDELRRAWEKPKFVRNVNYVVTLDKLNAETLQKVRQHKGARTQIKEWRELGMVDDQFSMDALGAGQQNLADANGANGDYKFLPLDTGHFKDMELEILAALGNLDEVLDGELVHSENWQALNTLRERYREKVKCIYIDPPYNTGGDTDTFLYSNDYKRASWLSFAENRISWANQLLRKDGFIAITIDHAELFYLGMLTDDVLSEENRVGNVTIYINPKGRQHERFFSSCTENMLVYAKDVRAATFNKIVIDDKKKSEFTLSDDIGNYRLDNFARMRSNTMRKNKPDFWYPLYVSPDLSEISLERKSRYHEVFPVSGKVEYTWKNKQETFRKKNKRGYFVAKSVNGVLKIYNKYPEQQVLKDIWTDKKYFPEFQGTNLVKSLMGKGSFSYPKSLYAVFDTLKILTANHDTVLDYFAGSGTTAHAIINLNREDGGNRKYLMIEMGDYFRTVLLPRIKKVVYSKDWKNGKPVSREGVSHCLKYYKLEQYEETLKNARYDADGESLELDSTKSPFEQYVFFGDDKLAGAVTLENGKLKINLRQTENQSPQTPPHLDIDIAETLSNALGKPIRRRTADSVTFADGTTEKTNPTTMTEEEKRHFISLIKPYLWWGE